VIADSAAGFAGSPTWVADVPVNWNGTLLLYSHGFGPLTALDAPDPATQAALLARGYALAGSSYDPNGSEWALDTAVQDQFGALTAVEDTVLPSKPAQVLAALTGTSASTTSPSWRHRHSIRGCRPCTRPPDSTSALTCRT
jgi:hypothetical protein